MAIFIQRDNGNKWVDWAGPHYDEAEAKESLEFWREMYADQPGLFRMVVRKRSPNHEKESWHE